MTADEKLLLASLDHIEQREARLLTWGLVDGFLTDREIADIIDPLLDDPAFAEGLTFVRVPEVVEALKGRVLIFDVGEEPGTRYRSRMAEAVRLFFRLRQLFPRNQGPTGWQAAPTLVADFRFLWRRRRYPRRDVSLAAAQARVNAVTSDPFARAAFAALMQSHDEDLKLAEFQVNATTRILSGFEEPRSSATLVSAGTGSGKTLAFYLPAITRVAAHIRREARTTRWVKILALYPRNELLKDQFAEVYTQARRLDAHLQEQGRRKIVIGTYFGPTPEDAATADQKNGWHLRNGDLVCDYLRCPTPDCSGDMVWHSADRSRGTERLVCSHCASRIESDEIILTRKRLEREAPDILFTTTEMLNQRMGDSRVRHLFGLGDRCQRPVEMMLLDEVHTYSGTSGAQVAFLLRRWRQMLRRAVNFVGLSATLKDAARFFARLTGVSETASIEITPALRDMLAEGAEYLLALRGDPVSRTALLSTTIQAAMLLSRMLDAPDQPKSDGIFGERIFLFADNIDVINRMYFAMLDAEGRRGDGSFDMTHHRNGALATLRSPMASIPRKLHGQDWEAAVEIGHSLQVNDRKSVGRVMSMDPGVGNNLDIIVATASLEVGFNDPLVGGIIQHKAPAEVAQFLQRKGRAGRSRKMRPWTVAVLSDYGRDRIAYQGYDLLFDPELPIRSLPIGNRYVARIQAVYATFDYLSQSIAIEPRGSVWTNLSAPAPATASNQRARQVALAAIIRGILTNQTELDRYAAYLKTTLHLEIDEIDALLWDYPRPLLTQVLPTALRRLETGWSADGQRGAEPSVQNSPLPEFAPAKLFGELNLPEVEIRLPANAGAAREAVAMPIAQALKEFAPGRVSRRYGLRHAFERHWICPPLDQNRTQSIALDPDVDGDPQGEWLIASDTGITRLPVIRPRALVVRPAPGTVVDTSNARLRWRTQIIAREDGLILEPAAGTPWARHVAEVRFYTHENMCPIETRRMAVGSNADIRFRDGTSITKEFSFEYGGAGAAVGFSLRVDAMCIRLVFPEALWSDLTAESSERVRAIRTARFHHQAVHGPDLAGVDNPFAREWLAHLLLAAVTNEAVGRSISLEAAADNLEHGRADLSLDQTLDILFQSPVVDDANGQGNIQDKLRQDLAGFASDPQIRASLFNLAKILWSPITSLWETWLRDRFAATAGAAALSAILNLCPEIDADGLVVDIESGPREPDDIFAETQSTEIWISELAPGGNGQIEEALRQYAEDPRRFFRLMVAALRDNDFLLSDTQLRDYVDLVVNRDPNGDVALAAQAYRDAYGAGKSERTFAALRQTLAEAGFVPFHTFVVALANRILRAGSSAASDAFFHDALRMWTDEEERLGIELDARVLAYRLARRSDIDAALRFAGIDTPSVNPAQWRFNVIYGLLWPRGAQIRRSGLALYSPHADLPFPEPLLVMPYLTDSEDVINILEPDWQQQCLERLADVGLVTLICPIASAAEIADAFAFLATNPVQTSYLSVFARVQAVRRVGGSLAVDVDIAEARQ